MDRHSSSPDEATRDVPSGARWRRTDPWPTADAYRLSLLASIQTAEDVDLGDFFRKVYPEVFRPPIETVGPEGSAEEPQRSSASSGEDGEVEDG